MKKLLLPFFLPLGFLFSQEILSIEPDVGIQGQDVWVMIYAEDTHFLVADTVNAPSNVNGVMITSMVDGSIINAISYTPITATSLEAMLVIPTYATPGEYNVTIEQGGIHGAVTVEDLFYIEEEPTIVSVNPSSAELGMEIWVTITGSETYFVVTDTVGAPSNVESVMFKLGENIIEAISFTPVSRTVLEAMFVIPDNAEIGLYDVIVEPILGPANFYYAHEAFTVFGPLDLDTDTSLPKYFSLHQNYPNPFNPTTTISFSISKSAISSLDIYDISGNLVRELKNGYMQLGNYNATWDGRSTSGEIMPSGFYIYQLKSESNISTKKMLMIK
jgi:hypothetical protein